MRQVRSRDDGRNAGYRRHGQPSTRAGAVTDRSHSSTPQIKLGAMARARRYGAIGAGAAIGALLTVLGVASPAHATDLHNCQFGTQQVFDVQWNITGQLLNVSGMN